MFASSRRAVSRPLTAVPVGRVRTVGSPFTAVLPRWQWHATVVLSEQCPGVRTTTAAKSAGAECIGGNGQSPGSRRCVPIAVSVVAGVCGGRHDRLPYVVTYSPLLMRQRRTPPLSSLALAMVTGAPAEPPVRRRTSGSPSHIARDDLMHRDSSAVRIRPQKVSQNHRAEAAVNENGSRHRMLDQLRLPFLGWGRRHPHARE